MMHPFTGRLTLRPLEWSRALYEVSATGGEHRAQLLLHPPSRVSRVGHRHIHKRVQIRIVGLEPLARGDGTVGVRGPLILSCGVKVGADAGGPVLDAVTRCRG